MIDEKIKDANYDSHSFEDVNNQRTGSPIKLAVHDFGLSTMIGVINKDAKGKPIQTASDTLRRIRLQDKKSQFSRNIDVNYKTAFDMLQRIQDKICVSDNVKELAAYIYRKATEQKITQGRSITAVVAASMYAACRNTQTLRTLREISLVTDIRPKRISQRYRAIVKQLDLKIPVVSQVDYISKISNNLGISEKTKRFAFEILQKAEEQKMLSGRDPVGMASASIYYACLIRKESFTQVQVADASGMATVTVRNRFQELRKKINMK
ncbi:transcription initiation factor IIB [Nitrosarchaeum sp.]|nr:transcription initiation factor IIB [Nitrosarchaeum sp.]